MSERTPRTYRLPLDMVSEIETLAQQDMRKLNDQVIVLLREALTARKTRQLGKSA